MEAATVVEVVDAASVEAVAVVVEEAAFTTAPVEAPLEVDTAACEVVTDALSAASLAAAVRAVVEAAY